MRRMRRTIRAADLLIVSRMDTQGQRVYSADVSFASEVYDLDVIKKAAYRFISVFATDIRIDSGTYRCVLNFVQPVGQAEAERLMCDLKSEVLDQDLRRSIATETAPIRNAILAYAFSKTGLLGSE